MEVVDNLRAAGVDQLGLLTEEIQQDKGKPASRGSAGRRAVVTSVRLN